MAWYGSRRLGGREDGGGQRGLGWSRAEMMRLVVALSRSSCAPRLRGAFEGK